MTDDITVSTPESAAFSLETAGLGSRFLALLLDMIIQGAVTALLVYSYLLVMQQPFYYTADDIIDAVYIVLLGIVLGLYHLIFEAVMRGRSPGKWAVGVRVVKTTGVPVGFWESCLRNLVRLIDFLPAGYLVGVIAILASPQSRRLGDLAAGTIVVRERRLRTRAAAEGPSAPANAGAAFVAPGAPTTGAQLSYREEELIAEFLSRRHSLTGPARAELARRLADRLHAAGIGPATFGLPSYTDDETLLNMWYTQRQR